MARHRVKVRTTGVLVVDAETEEEAERLARQSPVRYSGVRVFEQETAAEAIGEVDHHTLQPDDVRTTMDLGEEM